jgi:transcriptional regulator with XRE-family HTH domain
MTQVDLARALGVSAAMVSKLKRRGMPTDDVQSARDWCDKNLRRSLRKGIRGALTTALVNPHSLAEPPDKDEAPAPQLAEAKPQPKPAPARVRPPSDAEIMRRQWAAGGEPYRRVPTGGWIKWRP